MLETILVVIPSYIFLYIVLRELMSLSQRHEETVMELMDRQKLYYEDKLKTKHETDFTERILSNDIEKKDEDTIPITEETRIPITSDIKVKFEDEEEILSPGL